MTAPVLPESAVQTGREGSFVYIVGKDNKVKQKFGGINASPMSRVSEKGVRNNTD